MTGKPSARPSSRSRPRRGGREASGCEVAVVGAGPVGLAAALLVRQLGYGIALIAPPRANPDERTSALLGGSIALLDRLGIWPQLEKHAAPLRTLRIVDGTGRLIRAPEVAFSAREVGREAFGYNIPNAALVATLEAAGGEGIERLDDAAEDVLPGIDGATLTLASGGTLAAKLVIAADGRRSTIRDRAGIDIDEWRYDQAALVANLRHQRAHEDTSTEFHTESGPFTLVPLPGRRSSLVWVDTPQECRRRMDLADGDLAAEIEGRSASILGTIEIDGRRQMFPLSGMNARRFAADRVMLVGEAAHLIPPIGAQGLNLGYRDVTALGEVLAHMPSDPGAAPHTQAYDQARRGDVWTRTAAVDALNRTLLTPFLPVQALRGFGLFLLDRIPALRRAAMRQGLGTG
jgi:2-octaprenyl-6-methoxyphenol hydroxylase